MVELGPFVEDLRAESEALDALVAELAPEDWTRATPAAGWTIAHQIGHLNWTDEAALVRPTDSEEFARAGEAAAANPTGFVDDGAEAKTHLPPGQLLDEWRVGREKLAQALLAQPEGTKIPWFGPPMSAVSMATARLMETWAHGRDVADALGVTPEPTSRLRSIAHLGVRTRNFAYLMNGRQAPADEFRVELTAPDGSVWAWGPEDAEQSVRGNAEHFCLLVTQRAHRDDLDLVASGDDANEWLSLAQAFAGPSGGGREAGSR